MLASKMGATFLMNEFFNCLHSRDGVVYEKYLPYVTGAAKPGMWAQTTLCHVTGHISVPEQNICIL